MAVTKETRANLLFLSIFLAISLPGGVILFKKKLDPKAPLMYMPETMRKSVPYIAPADAPDLQRYVPDELGKWVRGLAREQGYDDVLRRGRLPVVSDQRRWQVIGLQPADKGTRIDLLLWDADQADSSVEVQVVQGKETFDGQVVDRQAVAIPQAIRKELIYGGYPQPPKAVAWVSISIETLTHQTPGTLLRLHQKSPTGEQVDSVTLFTN